MENFEVLKAIFSADALRIPEKLYRFRKNGARYYYNAQIAPCVGITSFLDKCLPKPYFLTKWANDIGTETAEQIKEDRAFYGSCFHAIAAEILREFTILPANFSFSFEYSEIKNKISYPLIATFLQKPFTEQSAIIDELRFDLLAFVDFVLKANMKALLIESPLASKTMQLAATLDYFGKMQIECKGFFGETYKTGEKKGEPKETKQLQECYAIVDFKTQIKKPIETDTDATKKQISLANKLQLNYQRLFLLENYPEFADKDIKLFNLVPSNWRTTPAVQLAEVEIIPENILRNFYEACLNFYPEIFDIYEKTEPFISGVFTNNIADVLSIEKIGDHVVTLLKQQNYE